MGDRLMARCGPIVVNLMTSRKVGKNQFLTGGNNDESAGKRRSGKTRKGNCALRTGLVQLAHSATHTKETYWATLFRQLAARRGKQRAIIAVAHSILVSVVYILVRHEPYRELGATHVDRLRHSQRVERLTRRLQQCAYA